jgi:hypothetical protein
MPFLVLRGAGFIALVAGLVAIGGESYFQISTNTAAAPSVELKSGGDMETGEERAGLIRPESETRSAIQSEVI